MKSAKTKARKAVLAAPVERKSMFVVMCVNKNVTISILGRETDVPLIYAEGMIGAMPIFSGRESAERYADGRYPVREIETYAPGS